MQAGGVCAESAAPPASNASTDSENEMAAERVRYMRHSSCGLYPQYPIRVYLIPSLSDTTAAIESRATTVSGWQAARRHSCAGIRQCALSTPPGPPPFPDSRRASVSPPPRHLWHLYERDASPP